MEENEVTENFKATDHCVWYFIEESKNMGFKNSYLKLNVDVYCIHWNWKDVLNVIQKNIHVTNQNSIGEN